MCFCLLVTIILLIFALLISALSWARSTLLVINFFVDVGTLEMFKTVYFLIFQIFMFFLWPLLFLAPIIAFMVCLDKVKAKIEQRRLKMIVDELKTENDKLRNAKFKWKVGKKGAWISIIVLNSENLDQESLDQESLNVVKSNSVFPKI